MVEGSQLEPDQPVGGTVHLIAEEGEILNVQLPAVLDVVDDEHDRTRRLDGFRLRGSGQIFLQLSAPLTIGTGPGGVAPHSEPTRCHHATARRRRQRIASSSTRSKAYA